MSPDKFIASAAGSVAVSTRTKRSNTWAIRHLSKFFFRPSIKPCTTAEDCTAGVQRARVLCTNKNTGQKIGIVEVCGPADALPKAALLAACKRIGVLVDFDATGAVTFSQAPIETPQQTTATPPTETTP